MLSLLQYLFDSGIIDMENKNAAAHRWANTREPARVQYHLHSGHLAAPLLYYTTSRPLSQGGFCRLLVVALFREAGEHEEQSSFTLCGVKPAQRFCFPPV